MGILAGLSKQLKHTQESQQCHQSETRSPSNPFLSRPVNPEEALRIFLLTARNTARQNVPKGVQFPITKPFCEIEARLGILKAPFGDRDMRVFSSGPKRVNIKGKQVIANAFDCTPTHNIKACHFEGGVTKNHFINWTSAGLSESSSVSAALGIPSSSDTSTLRRDLLETDLLETVYGGYEMGNRICFEGDHDATSHNPKNRGRMENKSKLATMDIGLPAASYDLRLGLATERILDHEVIQPPKGWTVRRFKRRRSYIRRDKSIAWQLDVTETVSTNAQGVSSIGYEIEIELDSSATLDLVNEPDNEKANNLCKSLAQQLWWMISQLNPVSEILDVDEFLQEHPDKKAVQLALAQCGALKKFMDGFRIGGDAKWESAIAATTGDAAPSRSLANLSNIKFPGCMPVNFSRHNIEQVQRSEDGNGYFLSEKTDGVRHFMVFTGDTVVLVDRAMKGKQPIPRVNDGSDPMQTIIPLINPGTVFDGEVVIHRKLRRPIFIVFDVLCLSTMQPVLHLPFCERLKFLKRASFRTVIANKDMFAESFVMDPLIPLPLVRKNFVSRMELDELLSHVVEEKGTRTYKNGELHNHLTDGIIFQPNLPYVCGTDTNLLKWKYLDTITIDVQIMPSDHGFGNRNRNNNDTLVVAVTGEDSSMVDMTRFIHLPTSELRKLEADRAETGANIAEVGLEPSTGEWYYLTMRPDKIAPNHISTVIGTLLELAESLGTEELRYRLSLPSNMRDTYRKDIRKMQKQLLDHQRKVNKDYIRSKASKP